MEQTKRVTRGSKQPVKPDLFIIHSGEKGKDHYNAAPPISLLESQQNVQPRSHIVSLKRSASTLSESDSEDHGQNDEQQERSPPSDDGQQGYQSPNAVTSNTDTQLNSQNDELQERSPSDDSQQGCQSPNAVTSNTDRQLHCKIRLRQNDEQQERSPHSDDGQQGYQLPNAVTSNTDTQLNSQNDEMQERSPSDDSQQGYQLPNAVPSNTDRQLNGPNDEMVRSSSGDECDDGQLGYQSLVALQPHPDIHQSETLEEYECMEDDEHVAVTSTGRVASSGLPPTPTEAPSTVASKQKDSEWKVKSSVKRKMWTEQEKAAVNKRLGKYFMSEKLPGKHEIEEARHNEPVLLNRDWVQIKSFIKNCKSSKRKLPKMDK